MAKKKLLAKPPLEVEKKIKEIGTDIGDEPTNAEKLDFHGDDAPAWLINILTICHHALALVESSIGKKLYGQFWTEIPGGRKLIIVIEEESNAKIG